MAASHKELEALFLPVLVQVSGIPLNRWRIGTRAGMRPTDGLFGCFTWLRTTALKATESPDIVDGDTDTPKWHELHACYCAAEIMILGNNSHNVATEVWLAMQEYPRTWDLWPEIGYGGVTDIQDASTPIGGKVQEWSRFNVEFYVNFERTYLAEYFTRVPVTINGGTEYIFPTTKEVCP